MNKTKLLLACALVATLELMTVPFGRAQELVNAFLSVTCVSTNSSGNLVYQHYGNTNLISQCATDEGLTNLSQLSLVYNVSADALQVVTSTNNTEVGTNLTIVGTNQYVVCTPLSFMNIVSLSGTNTNKVELLASVFVETNTVASGTLAATERFGSSTTNGTSSFTLIGRIQYAVTANGTNAPAIYHGVLLVGAQPDDEENEEGGDHHGNHGNNGNHGNGNNGSNGNHGNGNNGTNGNHGNGNNGHHSK